MKPTLFLALLALWGCAPQPATLSAMKEFSFTQTCASLPGFFADRNIENRGDPVGPAQKMSIFLQDPMFKVVEIRCARLLIPGTTDSEPMPVEVTFFSGGKDVDGRLTKASMALEEAITQAMGAVPAKKFTTGRWESAEWSSGPLRVRHFESNPSDTRDLQIVFSLYPSNDTAALDKNLRLFLDVLAKLPPPTGLTETK